MAEHRERAVSPRVSHTLLSVPARKTLSEYPVGAQLRILAANRMSQVEIPAAAIPFAANPEQMAERLMLRRVYEEHLNRVQHTHSGGFSLEAPHSFPRRVPRNFVGNCYERPKKALDLAAEGGVALSRRSSRARLAKPEWNGRIIRDRRMETSGGNSGTRDHTLTASRRPRSAAELRTSGGSSMGALSPYQWGVTSLDTTQASTPHRRQQLYAADLGVARSNQPSALPPPQPTPAVAPATDWSIDLDPNQARVFCDFVRVLQDVGPRAMVQLAQAAVEQAGAPPHRQ